MTENDGDKKTLFTEEKTEQKDGETLTTKRKSIMQVNPDGSTTITDSIVSTSVKNEIKLDENTKINVSEVDADLDDKKYIQAMREKNQLAVLKDTNKMICIIPLKAAENILKKMGGSLEEDFSSFAFGIYSMEEINEIRKSLVYEKPKKVFVNIIKDFDIIMPPLERLPRNNKQLNSLLFQNVQEKLDMIKAEEERKRREEEERRKKLEEANRLKLIEKEKRKEKACNKLKKIRNDNRLEILKIKFGQYRKNCEELRLVEQRKKVETEKKVLRLKIKRDSISQADPNALIGNEGDGQNNALSEEEQKKKIEDEEKKKKEQEEEEERKKEQEDRLKKEEEERLKKEEEERLKKEEEERKKKEEEERLKKEEEERKKKEEEERLKKEEEERKKKEEEDRLKKEEEERKKKEEEDRLKKEEEDRLKKEEEERLKKEEEERLKKAEADRLKKEEEERLKKAEADRLKKEEEERLKKEEEEKKKKEEEDKLKKEEEKQKQEEERLKKEEEEKKKKEEEEEQKKKEEEAEEEKRRQEEEKLQKEKEEEEKRRQEEEKLQKEKEDEEKRRQEEVKKKEEEDNEKQRLAQEELNRQKAEEEKRKQEEEEKRRQEEADKKKKEEEEAEKRKQKEEEERRKKEEEEAEAEKIRQEEEEKKNKEEEEEAERQKLALQKENKNEDEEEERQKLALQNANKNEDENKENKNEGEKINISEEISKEEVKPKNKLRTVKKPKKINDNIENKNGGLNDDNTNNKDKDDSTTQKEEQINEPNEDGQKPKKKKVLKKVKKIVKVPKKKAADVIDNRKPFYISAAGGGGYGPSDYHYNVSYTGHKPLRNLNMKNECINCHNEVPGNAEQNNNAKNKNEPLYVCENCIHKINPNQSLDNVNNGNKTLRPFEYYQNNEDDKYDPINTKEFFEMNRNRYLSELWKKENDDLPQGKRGVKSRSIEKINKNDFDKDKNNEYKNDYNALMTDNNLNNGDKGCEPRKIKRCRNRSTITMHKPIDKNDNKENKNLRYRQNKNLNNNIKNDNINEVQDVECPKCRNVYVLNPEQRFYYCKDCENIMCGKCSKNHYIENPEHNCSKADFNQPEQQDFFKASPSEINRGNNEVMKSPNNPINKSPKKRKLNVTKYINKSQNDPNLITNKNEGINDNINPEKEFYNTNLNNKGLLRNKPNNKLINDKNRQIYNTNYYNKNPDEDRFKKGDNISGILDEDNCFICGIKQKNDTNEKFYICRECNHLLCNNCKGRHDDMNPKHNVVTSYVSGELDNCFLCGTKQKELPNEKFYLCKDCDKIYCQNCRGKHDYVNPKHNIDFYNTPGQLNNCKLCGINQKDLPYEKFYLCNDCDNVICQNCIGKHDYANPHHNVVNYNTSGEINNCDICGVKQNELPNEKLYLCKDCKNLLCQNCRGKHDYMNPKHNIVNYDTSEQLDNCFICGINKKELPNGKFYLCRECDNILCQNCKGRHDDVNPKHNVVNYYTTRKFNNVNDDNFSKRKNMPNLKQYDYYEEYINPSNNTYYNKENNNNYQNNYGNQKEYKGKDNNKPNSYNQDYYNSGQTYYDNEKTPSKNNDNQNQFYINKQKNSMDNINFKDNNYNNTNKNYEQNENPQNINTLRSYNLQNNISNNDNMNMSPIKNKKVTLRRYNNNRYNDQENNYGNEEGLNIEPENENQNLRNKKSDLFKKKKCKIEFDLNKEDKEFDTCQIFGNPACFNCLKSKKNEKTIQIFYCSQCMKLFCRDCLYQHNYCS